MDFVFIVAFYFYCPETRKKPLEEIEALFGDDVAETLEEAGQHLGQETSKSPHVELAETVQHGRTDEENVKRT